MLENVFVPAYYPRVASATSHDNGDGTVRVKVVGANFLPETLLYALHQKYTGGDKMTIQDENHLEFDIKARDLFSEALTVSGRTRFRGDFEVYLPDVSSGNAGPQAIPVLLRAEVAPPKDSKSKVSVYFHLPSNTSIYSYHPLVRVGSNVFGLSDAPISSIEQLEWSKVNAWQHEVAGEHLYRFNFTAPIDLLKQANILSLRYNTWVHYSGDAIAFTFLTPPTELSIASIQRLSSDKVNTYFAVQGTHFQYDADKLLIAADEATNPLQYKPLDDKNLILTIPTEKVKKIKMLLFKQGKGDNMEIAYASFQQNKDAVSIAKLDPIKQGDRTLGKITGTALDTIKAVEYEGRRLSFSVKPDGTTLTFKLTAEMTDVLGERQLRLLLTDGTDILQNFTIVAR